MIIIRLTTHVSVVGGFLITLNNRSWCLPIDQKYIINLAFNGELVIKSNNF